MKMNRITDEIKRYGKDNLNNSVKRKRYRTLKKLHREECDSDGDPHGYGIAVVSADSTGHKYSVIDYVYVRILRTWGYGQ